MTILRTGASQQFSENWSAAFGAKNKKKVSVVVEKDHKGGIQRAYAVKIEDFSTQQLVKVFDRQISKEAQVDTD